MDEIRRVLRIILMTARTKLTVKKLSETYKRVTGCDIPHEEQGYWLLTDFLSDLPELLSVNGSTLEAEVTLSQSQRALRQKERRERNEDFYGLCRQPATENRYSNRRTRLSDVNDTKKYTQCVDLRVSEYFKDKLSELIGEFPEGVWCTQLPDLFKEKFGEELAFDRIGFKNLIVLCVEREQIFHCRKESECDYKLYDARRPIPKLEYSYDQKAARIVEKTEWNLPSDMHLHRLPEGAVDMNVNIPRDWVTLAECQSDKFRVVAAEIYDPSKFWLYKDSGQLEHLTADMHTFYNENRDRFRIPNHLFQNGRYCVAVVQNQYKRCIIVKTQADARFVQVFFIDYGSLGAVPKDQIWFLTREFVHLPAQAIRARLSGICPPTGQAMWSSEASYRFRQLAHMMHLEASIQMMTLEDDCIEVRMGNPGCYPEQYINSILVEEGHATYDFLIQENYEVNTDCIPKVPFVYLLPKFQDIERWLVPSVEEKEEFSKPPQKSNFS